MKGCLVLVAGDVEVINSTQPSPLIGCFLDLLRREACKGWGAVSAVVGGDR